jgi:hypothetical protein
MNNPNHTSKPKSNAIPKTCPPAAAAFIRMLRRPNDPKLRERFGRRLNAMLEELLPDRSDFEGVHSERDTRQDAILLLYQRYLQGNRELHEAIQRRQKVRTLHELTRSVVGALDIALKRRLRKVPPHVSFEERLHGEAAISEGQSSHERDAKRRSRTAHLLCVCEDRRLLTPQEISIVRKLVIKEISRSVVGNAFGLDAVALSRLLARCSWVLARLAHELGWREAKPVRTPSIKPSKRLQP